MSKARNTLPVTPCHREQENCFKAQIFEQKRQTESVQREFFSSNFQKKKMYLFCFVEQTLKFNTLKIVTFSNHFFFFAGRRILEFSSIL